MSEMLSGQTVRFMFEDSPIGMCSITRDGLILRRNPACDVLLDRSADSIFELAGVDQRARLLNAMYTVLSGEQRAFRIHIDAPGERRIEVSGIPMRGGTGDLMLHLVDVSDHHRREQKLREAAENDALTGLRNRTSFMRAFEERLAKHPHGTLLMIDLDGFKSVNDGRGHHAGDAVLASVAKVLRDMLADGDIAARLGGDEFALLLASETASANAAGEMLIRRITIAAGLAVPGVRVTASIGMVNLAPGIGASALLEAADRAMYAAKRAGKGRCVTADPNVRPRSAVSS